MTRRPLLELRGDQLVEPLMARFAGGDVGLVLAVVEPLAVAGAKVAKEEDQLSGVGPDLDERPCIRSQGVLQPRTSISQ